MEDRMTSKLVVNTIEADTGISSVSFASSISLSSTSKFFFSDAGIDIGPDTNINRPATGVLGFNINGSEKVRINSTGKVGIGTNNPSSPGSYTKFLEVSDNNSSSIIVSRSASGTAHKLEIGAFSGASLIESTGATSLRFKTNSEERLRIKSDGKVGIGTNNPLDSLHISSASPGILITDTDQASNTKNWSITASVSQVLRIQAQDDSNAGGGNIFDFYKVANQINEFRGLNSGNTWFVVDNHNQKVGIGVTNPDAKLEVRDSASTGIIVRSYSTQSTDTNKALRVRNNSDTNVFSVSHKGLLEIARGELGTYLKVGGDDASNGRALTFTSSNTTSNGALHTLNATSGNGAIALATAGTERFRIDRDGNITRPFQPAFSAQGDSSPVDSSEGFTGILSNYMTVMECNVGGHYKTSGTDEGKFVAPVAGNYFFVGGCLLRLRNSSSAGSGELTFYKNGSNISNRSLGYSYVVGSNDHDNVTISAIIPLAAGDKVHLGASACSSVCDWYWGEGLGNFNGFLIG